jgi:hypothetical protein
MGADIVGVDLLMDYRKLGGVSEQSFHVNYFLTNEESQINFVDCL